MNNRKLLRSQLIEAWHQAIEFDYKRQRINSERSLQASIWSKLNKIFDNQPRRMFIEPSLAVISSATEGQKQIVRVPDLVICNSREIIGVVEMKYRPNTKPNYKKDIDTLAWIAENGSNIVISNYRFRGNIADAHAYKMAKSVVFVWTGVHRDKNISLDIPKRLCCTSRKIDAMPPAPDAAMPWHPRAPCSGARVA
ncbi:hypothetical protein [Acidovorax sp.]|uniref:hypothetical protein n=1 Tax=Acidovorax sp. TaxID=1872122 RepID=UPI0025BA4E9B|nr:hypothetical protein [Acidovorax sp.]MBW8466300.1 hypothetical protein [Acidovorax sp.]